MKRTQSIQQLREFLKTQSTIDSNLVLVPTMGALHRGHFSLIKQAREIATDSGTVAVSIFLNPIQFDRQSDLDSYPSTLEADLQACKELGVDLVFTPETDVLYSPDRSVTVTESSLSSLLCGKTRPGHFDGVCTIVAKLFNLFTPTHAVFGKKDFQQLAIIRRLVRDLNFQTEIIGAETVREPDGLALSSRNVKLSELSRQEAPILHEALVAAKNAYDAGERSATILKSIAQNIIQSASCIPMIDYLECVDAESLVACETLHNPAILATATFFGDVRLIDNIELS